jgi:hypothetical protein
MFQGKETRIIEATICIIAGIVALALFLWGAVLHY